MHASVRRPSRDRPTLKLKLPLANSGTITTDETSSSTQVEHHKKKKKKHKHHHKKHKKHHKRKHGEDGNEDDEEGHREKRGRIEEQEIIKDESKKKKKEEVIAGTRDVSRPVTGGKRPFKDIYDNAEDEGDEEPARVDASLKHAIYGGKQAPSSLAYRYSTQEDEEDEDLNMTDEDQNGRGVIIRNSATPSASRRSGSATPDTVSTPVTPAHSISTSTVKSKGRKGAKPVKVRQPRTWQPKKKPLKEVLGRLLETLVKKDHYGFFVEPVDPAKVPNYSEIIKNPMDFSAMRNRLNSGGYKTIEQFEDDTRLVVDNAKTFNSQESMYYKTACRIWEWAEKAIRREHKCVLNEDEEEEMIERVKVQQHAKTKGGNKNDDRKVLTDFNMKDRDDRAAVVKEEEVDILGIDSISPGKTFKRQLSSVPQTPIHSTFKRENSTHSENPLTSFQNSSVHQLQLPSSSGSQRPLSSSQRNRSHKRRAKNLPEGVFETYPDGSIMYPDPESLIPDDTPFGTTPRLTIIRSSNNISPTDPNRIHTTSSRPAGFLDYGPFATLPPISQQSALYWTTPQERELGTLLLGEEKAQAWIQSVTTFAEGIFDGLTEEEIDPQFREIIDRKLRDSIDTASMGGVGILERVYELLDNMQDGDQVKEEDEDNIKLEESIENEDMDDLGINDDTTAARPINIVKFGDSEVDLSEMIKSVRLHANFEKEAVAHRNTRINFDELVRLIPTSGLGETQIVPLGDHEVERVLAENSALFTLLFSESASVQEQQTASSELWRRLVALAGKVGDNEVNGRATTAIEPHINGTTSTIGMSATPGTPTALSQKVDPIATQALLMQQQYELLLALQHQQPIVQQKQVQKGKVPTSMQSYPNLGISSSINQNPQQTMFSHPSVDSQILNQQRHVHTMTTQPIQPAMSMSQDSANTSQGMSSAYMQQTHPRS